MDDDDLYEHLKFNQKTLGAVLDPMASYMVARSISTMPIRLKTQSENAQKVAEFFRDSDAADVVYYPGLPEHPGYEIHQKQACGNGALLSLLMNEKYDMKTFCNSLQLFELAVSLGGVASLVCHPRTMTHEEYPEDLLDKLGIAKNLLRFSIGIEDIGDILDDIKQALEKARK